jgi:hypothetical protein
LSGYLLAGFLLGAALIIGHVVLSLRLGITPLLDIAVLLMVSGLGVAGGTRIVVLCISADSLGPFHAEDRVYLALGGVALIWVSISTAWTSLRE